MAVILIVEDRAVDRKLLSAVLRSAGHEVLAASDGGDALRLLEDSRPDLVVSDILMPTIDGYELVRRMRERPGLASIPVVFYTATYHEREAQALARQCGVSSILTKPSTPQAILDAVSGALAGAVVPLVADREAFDRRHLEVVAEALVDKSGALEAGEQRLAAMVDIARELTAERDPTELLRKVCAAARDVTLARTGAITMLDEAAESPRRLVTSGIDEAVARRMEVSPIESPVIEPVVRERRTVRVTNPGGRPEALGLPPSQGLVFSALVAPVASPTRVYGWLGLRNKLGAEGFSDRDEEIARALAIHAAIAYENARLLEDARRTHERTEFAMRSAGVGIWELDLESGRLTWSDSLAPIFGLTPDRAPRSREAFLALVHPADRDGAERGLQKAVADRTGYDIEFRILWPDGSVHWLGTRARIVFDGDRPLRVLGVAIDIDRQKSLEAQFRQAQKMEAVGQLAGGVAHDFNNMLTAILGNANLLDESLDPDSPLRREVEEVVKAGERAAALTRQLLAFSRKQVLMPVNVDINALVADMTAMLRRVIGEQIDLETRLDADLPLVRADAGQLEQVLLNLVVNARDAMPIGGSIVVETAAVDLDGAYAAEHLSASPGRYVLLRVTDAGVGMDAETQRRIFEPFFTTKERGKGTGLGLATVYGIVKQSGGYIWVYSEVGQGTTFKVYLPVAAGGAAEHPAASMARGQRGSETILLVEDEALVRRLATIILEKAGYRVLTAANAEEAEEAFARRDAHVDLLVTDVVMPGASGPALLQHLRAQRPGLRVLFMSGYTEGAAPAAVRGAAFLEKPFTSERLVRSVREALDR